MDPNRPIDLGNGDSPRDASGTPVAYLELVRRQGDLAMVHSAAGLDIQIEYPISPEWQKRLGIARFLRLRGRHDGKRHAVVLPGPARRARRRRGAHEAAHGETPLLPYVDSDPVGAKLGLEGAGIMAYQTGDHMHPPMVDSEQLWARAERWPEAAAEHTRAAALALAPPRGGRVLDIGCGIGGPTRLLVDEHGVEVHGIANAENMLATARRLNARKRRWRERIKLELHDCQEPYARDGFDAAWCMNMIYKVPDKGALLANAAAALAPGGRIMLEDWMFTDRATDVDRATMDRHYDGSLIVAVAEIEDLLAATGFAIATVEDLGHVGRTHMARHCIERFEAEVRPRLEADFPGRPQSGRQMADEWVEGIAAQINMYMEEKMTYRRYVAAASPGQPAGGVRL